MLGTGYGRLCLAALLFLGGCRATSLWNISPSGRIRLQEIRESSGLIASRRFSSVFWTHNDSENPPDIFAIDSSGRPLSRFRLRGAHNVDWEDIAVDEYNHLYVWENSSLKDRRRRSFIYVFPEPDPYQGDGEVEARTIAVTFPDGPNDCETLFIWEGRGYLVTKPWDGSLPRIYSVDLASEETHARYEGEVPVHAMVTGGDICPEGGHIILASYRALMLFEAAVPTAPPVLLQTEPVISRLNARQVEGAAWRGKEVILTNEQREIFELELAELKQHKAPFVRTPRKDVPYLASVPSVEMRLEDWKKGRWLKVGSPQGAVRVGRVAWSQDAVHFGIELPKGVVLRTLSLPTSPNDYEEWFRPGSVYLLVNPDGMRPLSYGKDDRCILIGVSEAGEPVVFAHSLQPGTLIRGSEELTSSVQMDPARRRLLLNLRIERTGAKPLERGLQIGFNLILIQSNGDILSWAPLTRRFTWDSPSVWGVLLLDD